MISNMLDVESGPLMVTSAASGPIGHLLARRLGLRPGAPAAGALTIEPTASGERWVRQIGSATWETIIEPAADGFIERIGPLRLRFGIAAGSAGLIGLTVGRWTIPLGNLVTVTATVGTDHTTVVSIGLPGGRCSYTATAGVRP